MFKFLKEKLKQAIAKFSKDVDKEADDVEEAPQVVEKPVKKEKPKEQPVRQEAKKEGLKRQERKENIPEEELEEKEEELLKEVEKEEEELEEEEKAEEKEEVPAAPEPSADLQGIKESLESYSNDELDSLIDILNMPGDVKYKPRDEKVKNLLAKPLVDINFAINQLENAKEVEEDKKEENLLEEVEKEEEKLEEPEEKEEKKGFFKRLFSFGKKKEEKAEEPEEKEEKKAEEETFEEPEEAEEKVEAEPEEKERLKKAKPEKPEEAKAENLKTVDEELEEIGEEEDELKKEIREDDSELSEGEEEKKGFFGKLTQSFTLKKLSDEKFEEIFFELEIALLENNVAVEVIEKIKKDLHERLVDKKLKRSQIEGIVIESLKDSLEQILDIKQVDILKRISEKRKGNKPFVIIFVGINGSGKTTTIAKMARYFMDNKLKTVMVAADTFRAAAIQQLEEHANRLGVKMIKHDYGSDPAAVAFDGIKYAEAKGIDVVLVDTAGRMHSNTNLMDEMKKVVRIAKPDMKIFIGESITGNDCIEQAQKFNEAIDIDGIVLSKADVDEKGGAAISVSYVTGKPILFIGTGQTYADLQKFDKKVVLSNLGLE